MKPSKETIARAYWRGRDSLRNDPNPFPFGTAEHNAWNHGHSVEHSVRIPVSDELVARRFAALNRRGAP